MRSLFHSLKLQCARCAAYCSSADPKQVNYCPQCGLLVGSPPHDAIFKQAYWLPADDEMAVFFAVKSIDQLAKTGVQIPARARTYVLQNERCIELPSGSYDAANLRARTSSLQSEQAIELLITRSHPLALNFVFDDLHTAEFLPLTANLLLRVKLDQVARFASQFMLVPGTLNTSQLQALLAPLVRQALLNVIRTKSLRSIQDQLDFYPQLDEQLLSSLNTSFADYGLALTQVLTQQLQHPSLSKEREELSEQTEQQALHLDKSRAQLQQSKQADEMYREREWQRISKQEEQVRLRYRHEEMRAQFAKDLGWLYLQGDYDKAKKRLSRAKLRQDEAERLQTIRLRELDLYAQIVDARTRQQAIDAGAAEMVRALEQSAKEQHETRQNEADQWLHVRTLARIKMRSESELTQLHSKQAAQLLQLQTAQQMQKIQLEHEIAQNSLIADQAEQAVQRELQKQKQQRLLQVEQELADERQKHALISISLETELRAREFQRMQAWEQELHKTRIDDLQQEQQRAQQLKQIDAALKLAQVQEQIDTIQQRAEQTRSASQQEKLQRTIELHARFQDQEQQRQEQAALAVYAIEESRMKLQQQHQIAMEKAQIERLQAIANFSETGKIATADPANANALADLMKLQTQSSMSAEQILATQAGQSSHAAQAMSAMAQIQHGMSLEQSMKMLQDRLREEREQREADLQRRHQLDLSIVQNLMPLQRPHAPTAGRK